MTKQEILSKTIETIKSYVELQGLTVDEIHDYSHVQNDLGLDSLELIELTQELEEEFKVILIINNTDTVNDIVFKIQAELER